MVKHTCICDRCSKEEDMKLSWDSNMKETFNVPDGWEYFGITPKYVLCPYCAADLQCSIEQHIYNFVNSSKNMDKDSE